MSQQPKDNWPPTNAAKVAEVLDWMRRGMNAHGKGLLLIAVGEHSVCFSKDPKLPAAEAVQILWKNIDSLQAALDLLRVQQVTRNAVRRIDDQGEQGTI